MRFCNAGGKALEASQGDAQPRKRVRQGGGSGESSAPAGGVEQEMSQRLSGHAQCVSGVAWPTDASILSCSWDHSVSNPFQPIALPVKSNTVEFGPGLHASVNVFQFSPIQLTSFRSKLVQLSSTRSVSFEMRYSPALFVLY